MSTYCEIVEELVIATSSTPATDVIVVLVSSGAATSTAYTGTAPEVVVSSGVGSSIVEDEHITVLASTGTGASTATPTITINSTLISRGQASSFLFATTEEFLESEALAVSSITDDTQPDILTSDGVASDQVFIEIDVGALLVSGATARSTVRVFHEELAVSDVEAFSAITALRIVDSFLTSSGAATDTEYPSVVPPMQLAISIAVGSSTVFIDVVRNAVLVSTANGTSQTIFVDPTRVAWVLNTETTAAYWYENYGFESITQVAGKTLGVGVDGLYLLSGNTDAGEPIKTSVKTGFEQFGTKYTKHVDELYFGYTSAGRISVQVETYESGHSPTTFYLEQRLANAPRTSRVTPGKGLFGRYWRMTIENVDGVDFEVHDTTADIAVSKRRV